MFYNEGMQPILLKTRTSLTEGLSDAQAAQREANVQNDHTSKPFSVILRQHVFTYFNVINFILFGLVLFTGSIQNALFMGIVLSNMVIGIVQEVRSRRVLDKLALLHQQKYEVLRSGTWKTVDMDQIVEGDLIRLKSGMQIPCDGVIVKGSCQVNESMLTGESDPLEKGVDQSVYAGCFVVAGSMEMQAALVGDHTYMASILHETKKARRYPSQLRDSLNSIITFCSWIIFPAGILLFARLFFFNDQPLNTAILSTVAAMVGMIPEGLVILTSIALASASVRLARIDVLVQELYCVENLARVDTLCLDKTGTITSGEMEVTELIPWNNVSSQQMQNALQQLYGVLEDDNATARAIRAWNEAHKTDQQPRTASKLFPFSSATKCAGAVIGDQTLMAGAYSFLFEKEDPEVLARIEELASKGLRVLALASAEPVDKLSRGNWNLLGLVVIQDKLRPNAAEIISYFEKQEVQVKIISGDMARTVAAIAAKAGVQGKWIDMSTVSQEQIPEVMKNYTIFGRVTPFQKKEMVEALQQQGRTVAMTGDGVNDVMALRQADCSIAMGSGSQAARSVASLVLLDDQFDALPQVVDQGRRVINNIQRTASLFLVKTLFSFGLTLMTLFWLQSYPFVPIQLTLTSFIGTGLPGFILTFEPNYARVKGNFMASVLSRAIPGAAAVILAISAAGILRQSGWMAMDEASYHTVCTILTGINALGVLYLVCRPLNRLRGLLLAAMAVLFAGAIILFPTLFMAVRLSWPLLALCAVLGLGEWWLLNVLSRLDWYGMLKKYFFTKKTAKE